MSRLHKYNNQLLKTIIIISGADVQRAQHYTDPKMKYSEYHRPSRPYVSAEQQTLSDVESLASELQNAKYNFD